jgi:hypothetical protein
VSVVTGFFRMRPQFILFPFDSLSSGIALAGQDTSSLPTNQTNPWVASNELKKVT